MIKSIPALHETILVPAIALEATTLTGLDQFMALESEWRALVLASAPTNPFLGWEWVSTWVRHFSGEQLVTVVVRAGAMTVAIAPFHRNRYLKLPGLRATALQLFGPREAQVFFEIREILAHPTFKPGVFSAIVGELERFGGWDWLELSAQGSDVETWDAAARLISPRLALRVETRRSIPVMSLAASWDDHKKGLKRNIKESIRHCYNSLQREGRTFSIEVARSEQQRIDAIHGLLDLHRSRSTVDDRSRHRDHFHRKRFRRFMRDALLASCARLFTLRVDGQVAAVRAAFDTGGQRYLYYSGFDPAWWSYGVMTLLVTEMVKDGIGCGLQEINLSPGVDPSKTRWGVELVPLHSYSLVNMCPASLRRRRMTDLWTSWRRRVTHPVRGVARRLAMLRNGSKGL